MAIRLFREAPVENGDFLAAKARWESVASKRRELRVRLDGALATLALAANPPGKGEVVSSVVAGKAREYLSGRVPNVDRLRAEVVDLEASTADASASYAVEAELWRAAVAAEAARLAETLRPKHKAAVAKIARAVEALSTAVAAEAAVRAELSEVGGAGLVDAGHEFGTLALFDSTVSRWNRRMLAAGLFD